MNYISNYLFTDTDQISAVCEDNATNFNFTRESILRFSFSTIIEVCDNFIKYYDEISDGKTSNAFDNFLTFASVVIKKMYKHFKETPKPTEDEMSLMINCSTVLHETLKKFTPLQILYCKDKDESIIMDRMDKIFDMEAFFSNEENTKIFEAYGVHLIKSVYLEYYMGNFLRRCLEVANNILTPRPQTEEGSLEFGGLHNAEYCYPYLKKTKQYRDGTISYVFEFRVYINHQGTEQIKFEIQNFAEDVYLEKTTYMDTICRAVKTDFEDSILNTISLQNVINHFINNFHQEKLNRTLIQCVFEVIAILFKYWNRHCETLSCDTSYSGNNFDNEIIAFFQTFSSLAKDLLKLTYSFKITDVLQVKPSTICSIVTDINKIKSNFARKIKSIDFNFNIDEMNFLNILILHKRQNTKETNEYSYGVSETVWFGHDTIDGGMYLGGDFVECPAPPSPNILSSETHQVWQNKISKLCSLKNFLLEKEEKECACCSDELDDGREVSLFADCDHVFCLKCIKEWFQAKHEYAVVEERNIVVNEDESQGVVKESES